MLLIPYKTVKMTVVTSVIQSVNQSIRGAVMVYTLRAVMAGIFK